MNKFKYFLLFISYFLFLISCSNKPPEIYHLQDSYNTRFYVINNYIDNEECIKYIFDFACDKKGIIEIVTNKNIFKFDDKIAFLKDTTKQRFSFYRERDTLKSYSIYVNVLQNKPIHFTIKEAEYQKKLTANFETLTVNIVQNFLDYAKEDEAKKEDETYFYILLNKNNQEKMKLIYHEYGAWFEVEVL